MLVKTGLIINFKLGIKLLFFTIFIRICIAYFIYRTK